MKLRTDTIANWFWDREVDVGETPVAARTAGWRARDLFTFFRVGALALLTASLVASRQVAHEIGGSFEASLWLIICLAYGSCVLATWYLARHPDWHLAWLPTTFDIVFAAAIVQLSGGADSPFTLLYVLAILGTVATGDRRLCWTAYGAALCIYATMSAMQGLGIIEASTLAGEGVVLSGFSLSLALLRNTAAMSAVAFLGATLMAQWERSQSQVGELRALYGEILRSLGSGVITLDTQERVIYANPAAFDLLAPEPPPTANEPDLIGQRIEEVLPGASAFLHADHGSRSGELRLALQPHREAREVIVQATPLRNRQGYALGFVLHVAEVTELRRLERELRRSERLAVIGQLAATVAHEVRNPLAAIAGCAELLKASSHAPEDQRLVAIVGRESARLETTVQQLLHFAREKQPHAERVEVGELTRELVETFRMGIAQQAIAITIVAQGPAWAVIDRDHYAQIIWNLLRNAVDALAGRGTITVEVWEEALSTCVLIRDDGPGIAPEHASRVFEPFFTTKRDGTGFGLAVVGQLVQAQGATIELISGSDHGAGFCIRWPRPAQPRATSDDVTTQVA